MRVLLMALLLAMLALAGCTDSDPATTDTDGDGFTDAEEAEAGTDPEDGTSTPEAAQTEPETPDIQTEFTFGPGAGCASDTTAVEDDLACASFQAGPDDAPEEAGDGHWIPLGPDYERVAFTSTVQNQRGDSDCVFTDADGAIIGDAHNGAGPCEGKVPGGATHMFLYSYAEPHQGMTLTFSP